MTKMNTIKTARDVSRVEELIREEQHPFVRKVAEAKLKRKKEELEHDLKTSDSGYVEHDDEWKVPLA